MIEKKLAKELMQLVHRPEWKAFELYAEYKKKSAVSQLGNATGEKLVRLAEEISTYDELSNLRTHVESIFKEHKSTNGGY